MEAFHFAVANEDNNAYVFDMRNLAQPRMVHKVILFYLFDVAYVGDY